MSLEPMYLLTVFVVALCAGAGWTVGTVVVSVLWTMKSKKPAA